MTNCAQGPVAKYSGVASPTASAMQATERDLAAWLATRPGRSCHCSEMTQFYLAFPAHAGKARLAKFAKQYPGVFQFANNTLQLVSVASASNPPRTSGALAEPPVPRPFKMSEISKVNFELNCFRPVSVGLSWHGFDNDLDGNLRTELLEYDNLIAALPQWWTGAARSECTNWRNVMDFVLDYGRRPVLRLVDALEEVPLGSELTRVKLPDLESICAQCTPFTDENRAGIPGSLHRVSRRLNLAGGVIGLSIRVGRESDKAAWMIRDILADRAPHSILILGAPGLGKTTVLRSLAFELAKSNFRVEVVDTSNEIAGYDDIPHPSIGAARRLMVQSRAKQHEMMIQAVQNHSPQILIIDEIGTRNEALAASEISQRGVKIIGSAHATALMALVNNQTLKSLIGGSEKVILSASERSKRASQSKLISERGGNPSFDIVIELRRFDCWVVYRDVVSAVDCLLGAPIDKEATAEIRRMDKNGRMTIQTLNLAKELYRLDELIAEGMV